MDATYKGIDMTLGFTNVTSEFLTSALFLILNQQWRLYSF